MAANVSGDALVDADTIVGDSKEMVELLVSLGADINTAKTLMCLHAVSYTHLTLPTTPYV